MKVGKRRIGAWAIAAPWAMSLGLTMSVATPVAVHAQEASVDEIRLRKLEADVRDLQRQQSGQLPNGAGAAGVPAATPVTDLLTRMDALETQVARLTAQNEELQNRQHQIETRLGVSSASGATPTPLVPAPTATPAPAPIVKSATADNLAAMTGGASNRAAEERAEERKTGPARPSAQRLAAVKAVIKPQTGDAGGDEYSYGFRLYTAKFYPEAEQQLKLYIDKYPGDSRISHARNLLGRAYLDEGKPRDAAPWFLSNYKADPHGARAADSLLNLAEAMRQLGDTNRACIALNEFASNYAAEAKARLQADYKKTRGGLTCS